MTARVEGPPRVRLRVRPKYSLLGNAFAAIVLGTTPIFAVTYWFTSTRGGTELAIAAHVGIISIALLLLWRQLRLYCAVTSDELVGNGIFSPLVRVPLARIHRVRLVPTFLGAAPEPVLQLLVTDANGRRLFRMRGSYWHTSELHALARALPVPVEETPEVLSRREFFTSYPGSAYWYENRLSLLVATIVLATLGGFAAVAWVMGMLGLPLRIL